MSTSITVPPNPTMRLESWAGGQHIILTTGSAEVLIAGTDDQLNAFADDIKREVKEGQQRRLEDEGGIMRGTRVKVRTHGGGKARKVWRVTHLARYGNTLSAWLTDEGGAMACTSPLVDLEVVADGGAR